MSEEILIVDDNADIRNIINELIIDAGYKTRLAANYNQALAEIDKKLPDVAILDVKLDKGDNDGIELLSHIKSKNKDTPVIIISGHANIEMAVKSLQHGAFEFIEKPFDQERLMNFVNRAVENFNLKNQNKDFKKFTTRFELYEFLQKELTAEKVKQHFSKICLGEVERFEAANLLALNFILHDSLGGGGSESLKTDAQGKTHGLGILQMDIEIPEHLSF